MKEPAPTTSSVPPVDDTFARLMAGLTERLQSGEPVDIESYVRDYPEYEERLRGLLPSVRVLLDLGISASGDAWAAGELPRERLPQAGVLGDYRIIREIGRGGMGVVYEAEQVSMGRRVALKLLPFAPVLAPRLLQRFQNEARAAGSLRHPNIVQVFSVGCERGVHYYAMEYIEGQTLAEVIGQLKREGGRRKGEGGRESEDPQSEPPPSAVRLPPSPSPTHPVTPSPPHAAETSPLAALSTERSARDPEFFRAVARLGIQAAEALEHAHGLGVVHRDIKPSNLMVESRLPSPSGRGAGGEGREGEGLHLWITDFGLAMTQTDTNLTMTGDLLGTLRYMSPEQVQAKHGVLDHRTDVYSLGLTLYELLTLQPAFGGDDRQKLLRQVAEDDPCLPRQLNGAIPKDLETIVLKATAKEPHARYDAAQDLADDLRRFLEDKPIQARRPTLLQRGAKWSRRHTSLVVSAAVASLLVSVLLGLSTLLIWREKDITDRALIETAFQRDVARKNEQLAKKNQAEAEAARKRQEAARKQAVNALLSVVESVEENRTFAALLWAAGKPEEAHRVHQRSVGIWNQVGAVHAAGVGYEGPVTEASLAVTYGDWGDLLWWGLGRHKEAEKAYAQAVAAWEQFGQKLPAALDYALYESARVNVRLGLLLAEMDRPKQAEEAHRQTLKILDRAAGAATTGEPFPGKSAHDLIRAQTHAALGELFRRSQRRGPAQKAYRQAAKLHDELLADEPNTYTLQQAAWFLGTCLDRQFRDAAQALETAQKAVKKSPQAESSWLTLALAEYRNGNWQAAVEACEKSEQLRSNRNLSEWHTLIRQESLTGGSGLPWLIRAIAHWHLGQKDQARQWYDRAVDWTEKNRPKNALLLDFRTEAEELIETTQKHHGDTEATEETDKTEGEESGNVEASGNKPSPPKSQIPNRKSPIPAP